MDLQFDTTQLPALWLTSGVILTIWFIHSLWQRFQYRRTYRDFLNLPMVGDPSQTDLRGAMEEGTRKYPDRPWILPLLDRTVILPHKVINEIKSLPESQASINANNYRRFLGRYTLMGTKCDEFVAAIKHDLTRQVGNIMGELIEETEYADSITIGGKSKTLPVYPTMLKFIALLSGRTMVGLPLSRRDEWIESSINYAIESVAAGAQLREYPTQLRRLVALFLPKIYRVREHQTRVKEMLHPILTRQREEKPSGEQEQGRLLMWLLRHYNTSSPVPVEMLGKDHLLAFFAAIHIATNALTHVILDLAARPEYMGPLRKELESEITSTPDGKLTLTCLGKMIKMDSFIKESLRASPPGGIVTLMRETTAPLMLSGCPPIPKGTLIAFANNRFDMSSPQAFHPDEFNGFRYSELQGKTGETSHQLMTPTADSLTWGYGLHACPGRLYAATELKVILVHIISNYDLRLREGESRPPNSSHDFQIMPHPEAAVVFTPRNV